MGANDDPAAKYARRCIEATLGVDVECYDRAGRQGAYDLRYVEGGRVVAVEVKRVVVEARRQAAQAEADIGYTSDPRLSRRWHLRLDYRARFKAVRREVPPLLQQLERIGWDQYPLWRLKYADPVTYERLRSLKVMAAWSYPPTERFPPGFELARRGSGGFDRSADYLAEFACEWMAGPEGVKLRGQLGNANAAERHAFLFIETEDYLEETAPLRSPGRGLPTSPPELPPPVNGLWLTGLWAGARLIAWLPERGWLNGVTPRE